MSTVLVVAGLAVVGLTLSDLFSTTLSVSSVNGIVSGKIADFLWRQALRLRLSHRTMRTVGLLIVVGLVIGWSLALWTGWSLVFAGAGDAIVRSTSGASASVADRVFFAGYLVSTLGNGDITAAATAWQLVTVLASISGLISVTLAITFLVPVAQGVVHRRQIAATIAGLGTTPKDLLERSFDGEGFAPLGEHLTTLISELHLLTQRHMAYPVLHYFHSVERHVAIAPMTAVLDESLLLIEQGTSDHGLNPLTLRATRDAVAELLRLLEDAFIHPADEGPAGTGPACARRPRTGTDGAGPVRPRARVQRATAAGAAWVRRGRRVVVGRGGRAPVVEPPSAGLARRGRVGRHVVTCRAHTSSAAGFITRDSGNMGRGSPAPGSPITTLLPCGSVVMGARPDRPSHDRDG